MATSGPIPMIADGVRAFVWRFGRKLYCLARGDYPNGPKTNGEYWLQDQIIGPRNGEVVVIDVGANEGDWALRAVELASRGNVKLSLFAFEPCAETRAVLSQRLAQHQGVNIVDRAVSSAVGEGYFYSSENGSGTNSLSGVSGARREFVAVTTLDYFLSEKGIKRVDMLKIDTEGFDLEVLRGCEFSLTSEVIEIVQFEYNWRWLINHASLRDVFEYIKDKPYRLGKLVGRSIQLFDAWHFELDRYFESNYVLIRRGSRLLESANVVRFDESNCARRIGTPSTAHS